METIHINISGRQTRPIAMHHTTEEWDELARYEPLTTVFHNNHTWLVINTIPETLVGSENMSPNTDIVNWCPFARHFFLTTQAMEAGDITARINGVVTRIPIGTNGQILAVDDGTLQWIDVSLEGGRVLGTVVDSRGFANNRGQSDVAVEAFAFKNRKPYYESLLTGMFKYRDTDGNTGRITPNPWTVANDIHRTAQTAYTRTGRTNTGRNIPTGQGFETTLNATLLPPEVRAGLLTSSNNSATSTPLTNEGQIRNGRFYRTLNNDAFGGLLNFDQPRTTDDPWRGYTAPQIDNQENSFELNPNDPNYYNEDHVQEALSLTTTGTRGSTLTLATNHNRATGEWDIFNSATAPNDRGLEVIDWVETQDLFFIFLCKPVGDDDENNRTLWAMGGIELYQRSTNRTTARLCWTNSRNAMFGAFNALETGGGAGSRGFTTQALYRAPQFTYKLRELTQISVAGAYDALFNADDDFQYSNAFQIPADSLTTGGHFAVRMVDGTYQLHAPFHDGTQRDNTSTALREYPASVTNRDLFVFNGQDRSSFTATQNPWAGTSGATTPDQAIQIGANFEFWKTGDSTITGSLRLNNEAGRTERNYTVGNSETIIQLKMITIWEIPYVNNFTPRTPTGGTDRPSNPPGNVITNLALSYAGVADGSEARNHPTTLQRLQSSRYPARLVLIALTEEGNVWACGEDSTRGALFSNAPTALNVDGVDPINMIQQTANEFTSVDRVEYILNTQDDLAVRLGGGYDVSFDIEHVNRLSLIRGNSIYVRETAMQASWQGAWLLAGSLGYVNVGDRRTLCPLFYDSHDWITGSTSAATILTLNISAMNTRMSISGGTHTYNFGRTHPTTVTWGNERVLCVRRTYEYTLDIGSIGRLFWINHHLYCINNHGTLLRSFVLDEPTITESANNGVGAGENTLFTWSHLTGMFNPVPSVSERTQLFGREL